MSDIIIPISGMQELAAEYTSVGYSPSTHVARSMSCTAQSW